MEKDLKALAGEKELSEMDALAVAIFSHGGDGYVCGKDGKHVEVRVNIWFL